MTLVTLYIEKKKENITGDPEGCSTAPRHAAYNGPIPSSAEGPRFLSFFTKKKTSSALPVGLPLRRPQSWGMWPFAEQEEADSNTRAVALAAIALGLAISSFLYLCQRQPATASPTKPSQPSQTAPTRSRSPARSKLSKAGAATPRALKGLEIDMAMPASGGSRTRRRAA